MNGTVLFALEEHGVGRLKGPVHNCREGNSAILKRDSGEGIEPGICTWEVASRR